MTADLKKRHHETVVERLRSNMDAAGLDALVAVTSENFTYINANASTFLSQTRTVGLAMIVIPAKGDVFGITCDFERPAQEEMGMVEKWYDFPMWIYIDDQFLPPDERPRKNEKTEFFELGSSLSVLTDRLKAAGVDKGRIGLEMGAVQAPIWEAVKAALPDASFQDATQLFYMSRIIKTPYEIEALRRSAEIQEDVVFSVMAEAGPGMSHQQLLSKLQSRALSVPDVDSIRFMFVSIGPKFSPAITPYDVEIKDGDLVRYDGALVVRGYGADAARTFIAGEPSPEQKRVNEALVKAHLAAVSMMGPGVLPRDVFNKAMQTVQENGLPDFLRGHVGHSVGLDHTIEEPPFLSAQNETPLMPGQVFCVELPYYAHNFGSIMNEDLVLITENGTELLTGKDNILHPIGASPAEGGR